MAPLAQQRTNDKLLQYSKNTIRDTLVSKKAIQTTPPEALLPSSPVLDKWSGLVRRDAKSEERIPIPVHDFAQIHHEALGAIAAFDVELIDEALALSKELPLQVVKGRIGSRFANTCSRTSYRGVTSDGRLCT